MPLCSDVRLHRDNRSDKELLDEALAVAAKSDVIVAALGESSEMSGESSCRTNLEMTDTQRILLQELLKTGKTCGTGAVYRSSAGTELGAGKRAGHSECMVCGQ